ncbi:MAG: hypothetical protein K1W32_08380, partial [Schaedlerella sp.]
MMPDRNEMLPFLIPLAIVEVVLLLFFSAVSKSSSQVLLGTGGAALGVYLISMFPNLDAFLPARLVRGMELLPRAKRPEDYYAGISAP